ncbi:packaging and recombination endonuclease [Salmonella phage SSBI34]|nr:packaging and recombination endonuclease [Salmonella phage SSBI34]
MRKSGRSTTRRFTSKEKVTKPIKVDYDRSNWVAGAKLTAYRKKLLDEQGGVCAILKEPMDKPCLDHDHFDGKCRGVIGSELNMFEGSVQKLWSKHLEGKTEITMSEALRRLADYLEQDNSDKPFHDDILKDLKKALRSRTKETISRNAMNNLGISISEDLEKVEMIQQYIAEFIRQLEDNYLYEQH